MGTGFAKLFDQMKIHRTLDIDGIFKYVQLICTFRMKIHKATSFNGRSIHQHQNSWDLGIFIQHAYRYVHIQLKIHKSQLFWVWTEGYLLGFTADPWKIRTKLVPRGSWKQNAKNDMESKKNQPNMDIPHWLSGNFSKKTVHYTYGHSTLTCSSYWCVLRREWGNDPQSLLIMIPFPHSHPFPTKHQ